MMITRRPALAAPLLLPALARAQSWPERPLRIIVPIAPGGLTDTLGRLIAARLSARLGQAVAVENRTGGGGVIGMEAAARAPADGHTLVLVYQGVASVNPVLHRALPYDTLRDFAAVALVATFPIVLAVRADGGPDTIAAFIERAKARPGAISYGSAGNVTTSHLAMELLRQQAGIDLLHVPFRGEASAMQELVAGRVDCAFASLTVTAPLIQGGPLRAIGIATRERSALAPQIPTIAEQGIAGFAVNGWYGVLAPKATPEPVRARLEREIAAILQEPETLSRLGQLGCAPEFAPGAAADAWIGQEMETWRRVVTAAGIRAD